MSWSNVPEAVFLGLSVGLMLWVLKRHEDQHRLRIWVISAGASMGLYLVLKMVGVSSEVMGV
ncbi:MAG TPA: hypothetical protein PK907_07815, partial [Candidatus Sabulitectum sp.]|nr:hypothetical protein [Candidatus Sabulitectum sp.]